VHALQVVEDVDQDGQVIGHDRDPPAGVLVAGDAFGLEAMAHGIDQQRRPLWVPHRHHVVSCSRLPSSSS